MLRVAVMAVMLGMALGACGSSHHRVAPAPVAATPEFSHYTITKVDRQPRIPTTVVVACANVRVPVSRPPDCVTPSGVDLQGLIWSDWGTQIATAGGTAVHGGARTQVYVDLGQRRPGCHGGTRYTTLTITTRSGSHEEHLPGC